MPVRIRGGGAGDGVIVGRVRLSDGRYHGKVVFHQPGAIKQDPNRAIELRAKSYVEIASPRSEVFSQPTSGRDRVSPATDAKALSGNGERRRQTGGAACPDSSP